MNKIDIQLQKIKDSGKIGLMTHVVIGYPNLETTKTLIKTLADAGSDFIELQIPFSDPIADGPTIMHASDVSLKNGTMIEDCFKMMEESAKAVDIPLLFMGYYNSIFAYGVEKFCKRAKEVGAAGLIFPDVPPEEEEYEHFFKACEENGLYPIRVISPASSEERLKVNADIAKGFVYCISRYGVTGAKSELDARLSDYLTKVRKYFQIPVAVGFGISKPEQTQALKEVSEIAVVGSAIIELVEKTKNSEEEMISAVKNFITHLKG